MTLYPLKVSSVDKIGSLVILSCVNAVFGALPAEYLAFIIKCQHEYSWFIITGPNGLKRRATNVLRPSSY